MEDSSLEFLFLDFVMNFPENELLALTEGENKARIGQHCDQNVKPKGDTKIIG